MQLLEQKTLTLTRRFPSLFMTDITSKWFASPTSQRTFVPKGYVVFDLLPLPLPLPLLLPDQPSLRPQSGQRPANLAKGPAGPLDVYVSVLLPQSLR